MDGSHYNFHMVIGIGSFNVMHARDVDEFNGWKGVGDIGGLVFFLYILHTILMIIIGFFVNNDSKFLNRENVDTI